MSALEPAPADGRGPRCRPLVVAALAAVLVAPLAGSPPMANPNELVRVELAVALATSATVDLRGPALVYGLSEDVAVRDDLVLADKAPGLSLAAVPVLWLTGWLLPTAPGSDLPAYWPLRHLLTATLVALAMAVLGAAVLSRLPGVPTEHGVAVAAVAILCTPLWTYGTVLFGHAPAALLVATAWLLLLGPRVDERTALIGGAVAAFAVAVEYPTLLLVLVMMVALVVRRPPFRTLAAAVVGLVAGSLPLLLYHQAAFGAPWRTGYAFKADPSFSAIHGTGLAGVGTPTLEALWGVTFGAARGLFWYSPVLLLAPIGLWLMVRRSGFKDAAPLAAGSLLYIAFAAGFVDWQAGWCAAARHLVPAVPLLVGPVGVAAAAMARRRWSLVALVVLVGVSATRTALTVAVSPFFPPEFGRPLAELVLPSLADGAGAVTAISALAAVPPWLAPVAMAVLAAGCLVWALADLSDSGRRRIALLLLVVAALQVGWLAWPGAPPHADPTRDRLRAQWLVTVGQERAAQRVIAGLDGGRP